MNTSPFPSLRPPRWPGRIARIGLGTLALGIVIALMAGLLNRFALAGVGTALMTLVAGLAVTMVGTAIAVLGVLIATAKRSPIPGTVAVIGIILGLGVTAYVLSWIERARSSPPIHDITTDLIDPPAFVAVLALRAHAHAVNSPEYVRQERGPGGRIIDVPQLQRKYYPGIKPLRLAIAPNEALARARHVAKEMGWKIDAYVPSDGRLEATAHTFFFDFKDDVVVRVRPIGTGSRVDVRSESRVGVSDVGTNAARIRLFMKRMQKP